MSVGELTHLLAGVVVLAIFVFCAGLVTIPAGSDAPVQARLSGLRLLLTVTASLVLIALLLAAIGIANSPWAFAGVCLGLSAVTVLVTGRQAAWERAKTLRPRMSGIRQHRIMIVSLAVTLALVVGGIVLADRAARFASRPTVALSVASRNNATEVTVTRASDIGSSMVIILMRDGHEAWRSDPLPTSGSSYTVTIPPTVMTSTGNTIQLLRDSIAIRSVSLR